MRPRLCAVLTIAAPAACQNRPPGTTEQPPPTCGTATLQVRGNQLVDATARPVRLRGVNRSGAEYACAQGWGIFDGPSDSASVAAIASWRANAVRVPLNETCWLGINGVAPAYSGDNYRRAISDYVARLHRAGRRATWTGRDQRHHARRRPVRRAPLGLARVQAHRSARQSGRVVARLQLQLVQHPAVLGRGRGTGGATGAAGPRGAGGERPRQ